MEAVSSRFLRYVSYDTMSDENSPTCPSTQKQKLLGTALVEEMLAKVPYDAPKFSLDPEVKDFYAFTPDSVKLEGYQAHPVPGKIPVAV